MVRSGEIKKRVELWAGDLSIEETIKGVLPNAAGSKICCIVALRLDFRYSKPWFVKINVNSVCGPQEATCWTVP